MRTRPFFPFVLVLTLGVGLGAALPAVVQSDDDLDPEVFLGKHVGTWSVDWWMQADGMPAPLEWTTTTTVHPFGNWILRDVEGELFPGLPYHGFEIMGRDQPEGRWVSVSVDTLSSHMTRSESIDVEGESPVMAGTAFDEKSGVFTRFRTREEWLGADKWIFHVETPGKGGWSEFMRAKYVRVAKEKKGEKG